MTTVSLKLKEIVAVFGMLFSFLFHECIVILVKFSEALDCRFLSNSIVTLGDIFSFSVG